MKINNLHAWDISIKDAPGIQKQLAGKVLLRGQRKTPEIVAGADISFGKFSSRAFAGVVLLKFPSMEVMGEFTAEGESAELLETITEQTLAMMNDGATLDDVLSGVKLPEDLLARPYLRPIYDDPLFIVRNLWRLYGGWYDGNPARLKPSRDADLARAVAVAAGGARKLSDRAEQLCADGELSLACELAEFAWRADPDDDRTRGVRATVYRARAKAETSLMAKGIYNAAAAESEPEESA